MQKFETTRPSRPLLAIIMAFALTAATGPARADEAYTFVIKKQEEKEKNRWSLTDWLETRDRMRLMDLWLAVHSPSPYEFYIGADYRWANVPSGPSYNGSQFYFAGYASIFGLGLQSESDPYDSRWHALFLLRVFGFHAQGTNITLQGGVKNDNNGVAVYRNPLFGVNATFYMTRYFGIEGLYRHYLDSTPNSANVIYSGNRYELGAFVDFRFLRIYGTYFTESEDQAGAGVTSLRSGTALGSRFFF